MGAGGLGLMCLTLLKAMGGKGAIVVDIDERKREAAMKAGALAAIDGAASDAARPIRPIARGPARAALDYVGANATGGLRARFPRRGAPLRILRPRGARPNP